MVNPASGTAGYSGTPLVKLGYKEGFRIITVNALNYYDKMLGALPDRTFALVNGLVDVKVCAVDEVWSGLKLVIPVSLRT